VDRLAPSVQIVHLAADDPISRVHLKLDQGFVRLIVLEFAVPHRLASISGLYQPTHKKEIVAWRRHEEAAIKHEGTKVHKDHKGSPNPTNALKRHKEKDFFKSFSLCLLSAIEVLREPS